MFAVDEFALPSAVRRRVCPDVVEVRVAAPDASIMEQHDTGVTGVDAVEHADVDGVEPVADSIGADHTGRRRVGVIDRGQDSREPDARQIRAAALEMNFLPTMHACEIHRDIVDVEYRDISGIVVMARHHAFGGDDAVGLGETTDERRAGIAAIEPAARGRKHHAGTFPALRRETEFVQSLQHALLTPESAKIGKDQWPTNDRSQVPLIAVSLVPLQNSRWGAIRSNALPEFG